jgi:hypothetical protein
MVRMYRACPAWLPCSPLPCSPARRPAPPARARRSGASRSGHKPATCRGAGSGAFLFELGLQGPEDSEGRVGIGGPFGASGRRGFWSRGLPPRSVTLRLARQHLRRAHRSGGAHRHGIFRCGLPWWRLPRFWPSASPSAGLSPCCWRCSGLVPLRDGTAPCPWATRPWFPPGRRQARRKPHAASGCLRLLQRRSPPRRSTAHHPQWAPLRSAGVILGARKSTSASFVHCSQGWQGPPQQFQAEASTLSRPFRPGLQAGVSTGVSVAAATWPLAPARAGLGSMRVCERKPRLSENGLKLFAGAADQATSCRASR